MSVGILYPNALVTPEFTLTQLEAELNPEFKWEELVNINPGAVFAGFTGMESHDPRLETATTQIRTILDAIIDFGSDGTFISFSNIPVDLEYRKGRNLGTKFQNGDSVHTNLRAGSSMLWWKGIKANEKGFSKMDICWKPIEDANGNPPFVPTSGVPISTNPITQELYRPGPVVLTYSVNGGANETVELCNTGWTWENKIEEKRITCGGSTADKYFSLENIIPNLTVPTENQEDVFRLYRGGSIVSVDCYLRRCQQGGLPVAIDAASHIKLSSVVGTAKAIDSRSVGMMLHSFTYDLGSTIPA